MAQAARFNFQTYQPIPWVADIDMWKNCRILIGEE